MTERVPPAAFTSPTEHAGEPEKGRLGYRGLSRLPLLYDMLDADESVVAQAYERAFDALSAVSLRQARELASDWSWWAASLTEAAADAFWCWLRAAAGESRLRVLGWNREGGAPLQALAAETSFWLLTAGRSREGALALDLGRTIQLAASMHREPHPLDERLAEAGRLDLSERWQEMGERPPAAPRDSGFAQAAHRSTAVGGQEFKSSLSARDWSALGDHERLVREITRLPAFDDVAATPTYEDLREAARDGPIVYLAATADGAFAVIVTGTLPDPEIVVLPGLTADDIDSAAGHLIEALGGCDASAQLEAALELLGRWVVDPVAGELPAAAHVTFVPIGALNLLPVHAARMRHGDDGLWEDRTRGLMFRYTQSARALARSRAAARDAGGPNLSILTVHVPHAPEAESLRRTPAESSAVDARFGAGLVRRPASGATQDVRAALDDAPIWHLACRAEHDPSDPLSSCLQLRDGPLALRTVTSPARGSRRLAVLSASRMAPPADELLDEIVSLQNALVELGVAGVVSAPEVRDGHAAGLLVELFFERFLGGAEPAQALADAHQPRLTSRGLPRRF